MKDTEKFNEDKVYWENRLYNCKNSFESIPENFSSEKILIRLDDNYLERWELFLRKNHLNENIFLITLLCIYKYRITDEKNGYWGFPIITGEINVFITALECSQVQSHFYILCLVKKALSTLIKVSREIFKKILNILISYNELIK